MPRPLQLSRYPVTVRQAATLAAAAADGAPAFVLLVFEDDGVLVAARHLDLGPAEVESECAGAFSILADADVGAGPVAVVAVSFLPGFGSDPAPVLGTWHELCRRAGEAGVQLLDWLLVDDRGAASLRAAVDPTTGKLRR